jgi:hypothetical protein
VAPTSQLSLDVRALRVNRLSFISKVSDPTRPADGRVAVLPAARVGPSVQVQSGGAVVCTMDVSLDRTGSVRLSTVIRAEELERTFEIARQQAAATSADVSSDVSLKLSDIATALQSDWVALADRLAVSDTEVIKIQTDFADITEQALIMLHLWVAKSGRVVTVDLETALKQIGRTDVVDRYIYGIGLDVPAADETNVTADMLRAIDSPEEVTSRSIVENMHLSENNGPTDEVVTGDVYQIEEVWDGNQFHKSKKMVSDTAENEIEAMQVSVSESVAPPGELNCIVEEESHGPNTIEVVAEINNETATAEVNGAQQVAPTIVIDEAPDNVLDEDMEFIPTSDSAAEPEATPVVAEDGEVVVSSEMKSDADGTFQDGVVVSDKAD